MGTRSAGLCLFFESFIGLFQRPALGVNGPLYPESMLGLGELAAHAGLNYVLSKGGCRDLGAVAWDSGPCLLPAPVDMGEQMGVFGGVPCSECDADTHLPHRYPLYQLGNPQLRVFRTNFFIRLVRPGTAQPEDTVQFRIDHEHAGQSGDAGQVVSSQRPPWARLVGHGARPASRMAKPWATEDAAAAGTDMTGAFLPPPSCLQPDGF